MVIHQIMTTEESLPHCLYCGKKLDDDASVYHHAHGTFYHSKECSCGKTSSVIMRKDGTRKFSFAKNKSQEEPDQVSGLEAKIQVIKENAKGFASQN